MVPGTDTQRGWRVPVIDIIICAQFACDAVAFKWSLHNPLVTTILDVTRARRLQKNCKNCVQTNTSYFLKYCAHLNWITCPATKKCNPDP